jgi:nicotinamide-nucleotide amidase
VVDTNAAQISTALGELGVRVTRHACVGDDLDALVSMIQETGGRADVAVVTGGLGPTMDDLASEAAARAAGVELVLDSEALAWIEGLFALAGRHMRPSNKKQAWLPAGARRIDNHAGTAPGFSLTIGRCLFFFLPGVPVEMRLMMEASVLPRIRELFCENGPVYGSSVVSTFGATEAAIGEEVADIPEKLSGVRVGLRAVFPEIQVKLYAEAGTRTELEKLLEEGRRMVEKRVGQWIFSTGGKSLPAEVGELLRERKSTVALAESCTGGLIAHMLTQVPGSSDYFLFSGVTYSNAAKEAVLGVKSETLRRFGAVHEETAKEMAIGAARVAKATFGLSTSGIAGPAGGTEDKPAGTVCIGLAAPGGTFGYRFRFPFDRERNKIIFAMAALEVLRRHILKMPIPPWPK